MEKKLLIRTEKLCKTFAQGEHQEHILQNIDLEIYQEDFTVIMGASGSGKSTLLYLLSSMDRPSLGKVIFAGRDITACSEDEAALFRREHCGFIFQQIHLIDSMSVMDNLIVCGLLGGQSREQPHPLSEERKDTGRVQSTRI
ncbi:MAG: ATP-binding cassette domain-containing protein [Peptostreptococcaceae bacterium]|nr:ATP-binding cassette domain-containing protein [Peptostreptococcaceae bacterium]